MIGDIKLLENKNVLLIDDEKYILKTLGLMFKRLKCSTELIENRQAAVDMYKGYIDSNKKFDFVIMDLTMPGQVSCIETVNSILNLDPYAKIIACSGYSDNEIIKNYQKYGFKGKLIKPFDFDELKRELLRISNL